MSKEGRALRGRLDDLSMKFDELPTLLTPEKLPYLSGVERLADGTLHVAVLTRMPDVSPRIIGWWFGGQRTFPGWHIRNCAVANVTNDCRLYEIGEPRELR